MNEIDKLAWLRIQDHRLLGVRSRGSDAFYIPGGKREEGESDSAALIREIKEELTVDLSPSSITLVRSFKGQAHSKPAGMQVLMTCYTSEYTGEIKANAEIEELAWLRYADKPRCSLLTRIILDWLRLEGLIA